MRPHGWNVVRPPAATAGTRHGWWQSQAVRFPRRSLRCLLGGACFGPLAVRPRFAPSRRWPQRQSSPRWLSPARAPLSQPVLPPTSAPGANPIAEAPNRGGPPRPRRRSAPSSDPGLRPLRRQTAAPIMTDFTAARFVTLPRRRPIAVPRIATAGKRNLPVVSDPPAVGCAVGGFFI